ncbi:MAG: efflux RND transporter periplasmic adaptor subunit [Hydrogenophilales bacterium CG_4_9_14_3_um_filter_63_34]|nr:MAG: efflux RND transporter periplasmic adaptor subunit [Hydrogenophilales bacterium CG_4_10_14_3_um_filter_63_21]PJB06229.1 MAG: efflux RND transporter periplasmic adaptor subunit [Hydrogenophilales bacterium CG_4_9_14_3_um_filter_63_34]
MNPVALVKSLLIALFLSLAACSGDKKAPAPQAQQRAVQAQTRVIQTNEATSTTATTGSVVALESVQVASRLMGYPRDIAVVEGQTVKKGQRLFTIDPLDLEGALEQARLGLRQAEDAMRDAKADFDRFESLYKDEVVSRQQYEKMKLNHDIALSRAAQAKAGLATAQGQMRYATVTAPIAGVITRKLANEGDIASPGHPVLLLENPARLQVQTAVSEALYRGIKAGDAVMVEIDGLDQPVSAKVARLNPAADPITHTYSVKLDLAAPGLRSGAFARVLFPTGRRGVLALPRAAVLDRAGITGAFVVDARGTAHYRMLRLGQESDGQVEVLSGLNPGERVVTGNVQAVNNGDQVSE